MAEDKKADGAERRVHERTPVEVPVLVQFAARDDFESMTANLSAGGMFIRREETFPVGTLLRFRLSLGPEEEEVSGLGEVVWIRVRPEGSDNPIGLGVQFRHIDTSGIERLIKFLAAHGASEDA